VLLALLQQLRRHLPEWKPVVLSADPQATGRIYGVEACDRWRPAEVWREIRRCTALIHGGGSLLQDVTGRSSLLYYLGLIWMARLNRKPVFVYCQGLGPLVHADSRLLVGITLARTEGVALRDEESASLLASLGVSRPALVAADPVLTLDPAAADTEGALRALARLGINPGKGPLLLVNLRPLPSPYRDRQPGLERAVAAAVQHFRSEGWQILVLPLHRTFDREICCRIDPSAVPEEPLPLPVVLGLFSLADLVVGMRLHALIFAALFRRPLVGLIYDPKVAAFLRQVEGAGLAAAGLDPRLLIEVATEAWERRQEWSAGLSSRLAPLIRRADSAAEWLKLQLEGNPPQASRVS